MKRKQRKTFNEINITPLTDIFLVLLIIMMVIAPLLDQQGLNLTVPDMVESQDIKESKILNVLVTNDNKIIVDNQQMELNDIEHIIKSKSKEFPDGLMIRTEALATHGAVVKIMDIARNNGVINISLSEV